MRIHKTASGADIVLNLQLGTREKEDEDSVRKSEGMCVFVCVCITHTSLGPLISSSAFLSLCLRALGVHLIVYRGEGSLGSVCLFVYVCTCSKCV